MAEFFSLLSSFLSHYFLRWLIFFPSFLPSLNHLWAYVKIYIDNNNNYLHDDLKSIFKCLLFFHLDDETYMWDEEGLGADIYFTDFKKGSEKLNHLTKVR